MEGYDVDEFQIVISFNCTMELANFFGMQILFLISHCRQLILENFVPLEDRTKIRNRGIFDEDIGEWSLKPLTTTTS